MFAEDIDAYFDVTTGFALAATRTPAAGGSAQEGVVILDQPGLVLEDAGVVLQEPTALIPGTQWPGVAVADAIVAGGTDFVVRQVLPVDDGATKRLVLARA